VTGQMKGFREPSRLPEGRDFDSRDFDEFFGAGQDFSWWEPERRDKSRCFVQPKIGIPRELLRDLGERGLS
jgi:hypothetical protein